MNGPSLTSSTCISAPKRPVAVRTPRRASASAKRKVEPLGEVRGRRVREPGPAPASRVGVERELRDDEGRAAGVEQRAIGPARVVPEDAQLGHRPRQVVGAGLGVRRADTEQDDQAGPDLAHDLTGRPAHADRGAGDALEERPHGWLGGAITPRSRMNASRHASASPR